MNKPHLLAVVIDDVTNERLEGVPTFILYTEAMQTESPVLARHHEGSWILVQHRDLTWHKARGHEVRLVRVEADTDRMRELDADDMAALTELRAMLTMELS